CAEQSSTVGLPQATQSQPEKDPLGSLSRLTVSPVELKGGGKLTFISPERWSALSDEVVAEVKSTHQELSGMFGEIPAFTASIRLTDQDSFHRATGAPGWTNALYYRGQILIPLSLAEEPDLSNLKRSLRHEYTHAVINALSAGKAPGWLDEGIAQWMEGEENPALRPALAKWLEINDPVPLALMQGGFTKMAAEMVPAAYAQSLFSATVVINTFGFEDIGVFLKGLRQGMEKDVAFAYGFSIDTTTFERRLGRTLRSWQQKQPFTSSAQMTHAAHEHH
ncbi:MAG: hypothetical protein EBZ48_07890, partial [Proteobacteria bacterium]|nr:hypothetical protein [Pseudomonadota bacterium]